MLSRCLPGKDPVNKRLLISDKELDQDALELASQASMVRC